MEPERRKASEKNTKRKITDGGGEGWEEEGSSQRLQIRGIWIWSSGRSFRNMSVGKQVLLN